MSDVLWLVTSALIISGCVSSYKAEKAYVYYTRCTRGSLARLKMGYKARRLEYICIANWAGATICEVIRGNPVGIILCSFNTFVAILIHKSHDFDDLDSFGSSAKKKLKAMMKSARSKIPSFSPGKTTAPMPI